MKPPTPLLIWQSTNITQHKIERRADWEKKYTNMFSVQGRSHSPGLYIHNWCDRAARALHFKAIINGHSVKVLQDTRCTIVFVVNLRLVQ